MKIVFMGTPIFAVSSLERILSDGHEVVAVFTQPDKPKGRGHHMEPTPVKETALKNNIPVFQPLTLKDETQVELIKSFNPDVIVVVAYGRILPESVLNIPRLGCINVHASLLPRYRGAAPIQWSIINDEEKTGITTMYMAKGLDTGDMILKNETKIAENETYGELHDRLKVMGAETLSDTLKLLEKGTAPRKQQTDENTCYASMIEKTTGQIDFSKTAREVHKLIMGLSPKPGAYTFLDSQPFKLFDTEVLKANDENDDNKTIACGTVVEVSERGLVVICKDCGKLLVKTVQAQGGKKMSANSYANGHGLKVGTIFSK